MRRRSSSRVPIPALAAGRDNRGPSGQSRSRNGRSSLTFVRCCCGCCCRTTRIVGLTTSPGLAVHLRRHPARSTASLPLCMPVSSTVLAIVGASKRIKRVDLIPSDGLYVENKAHVRNQGPDRLSPQKSSATWYNIALGQNLTWSSVVNQQFGTDPAISDRACTKERLRQNRSGGMPYGFSRSLAELTWREYVLLYGSGRLVPQDDADSGALVPLQAAEQGAARGAVHSLGLMHAQRQGRCPKTMADLACEMAIRLSRRSGVRPRPTCNLRSRMKLTHSCPVGLQG